MAYIPALPLSSSFKPPCAVVYPFERSKASDLIHDELVSNTARRTRRSLLSLVRP